MIQSWVRYILVMKPTLVAIWMKTLFCKKSLLYFEQFSIVRTSEAFLIKDTLYWKTNFIFLNVAGFFSICGCVCFSWFFLTETLVLNLRSFNIAENANIVGTAF